MGKRPSKCVSNTIQQAVVIVGNCGTDKSVPYGRVGGLPSNEPWWFSEVSERINPFPTNTSGYFPFICPSNSIYMINDETSLDHEIQGVVLLSAFSGIQAAGEDGVLCGASVQLGLEQLHRRFAGIAAVIAQAT